MLQHPTPDDYVLATGVNHAVEEFVDLAFNHLGLNYRDYVEVDPRFYRPAEDVPLCGNASKIRQTLGWQPTKPLPDIIAEMVDHDLRLLTR